jgi:hypothetical protein
MNSLFGFRDNSTPKTGANAVGRDPASVAAIGYRIWTSGRADGITASRPLEPAEPS